MKNINLLAKTFGDLSKGHAKVSTAWATVKSVDWPAKTMVATGVTDKLDYFDVLLGLGSSYRKPAIGSKCLLGVIENKEAAAFLIEAEKVDECVLNAGKISIKNESESLKVLIDGLFTAIGNMVFTTNNGPTIKLVNEAEFSALKTKFNKLLK